MGKKKQKIGQLTKNFNVSEFVCPCCGVLPFGVLPLREMDCHSHGFCQLIYALQRLRDAVAYPIYINSGCRCPDRNRAIGGSRTSQHLIGAAADIVCHVLDRNEFLEEIYKIQDFAKGGILIYRGFIHVDVREHKYHRDYTASRR